MRIVIVGDGKVGSTLTEYLSKEGYDVVVIDSSPRVIENAMNNFDIMGIKGNGASYAVQMEAGVNRADVLIAATSSDELNILCCMTAKKLGAKHTIARVRNPEYSKQLQLMREELGLSMVVNPEYEAAVEISRILRFPSTIKIESFSKGRVELAEIRLVEGCRLNGMSLAELGHKYNILVCAVQREDSVHIPDGDFLLRPGDKLHITASHPELASFLKSIGMLRDKIRSVMIIGGGKIAFYLVRHLQELNMRITIIEFDRERCHVLSDAFPKAQVIHGDGTDQGLLFEEGVDRMDACISLTDIDEENIVISLYATTQGVEKIITKVNRISFLDMLTSIGLDTIISPKSTTANRIVRYIRAMRNSEGSSVKTLYKIINNQVEALEFAVSERSKLTGVPLRELTLKKNLLIAGIIRSGKLVIPRGDDTIEPKDSVIVVATNQYLRNLNDILD
ncbi:MAG: Trk system potassium transporter TrkA [Acetanaerobacterium sp.]